MKTWKKWILLITIIGLIGAIMLFFLVYNKPHVDYERAKPEIEIYAADLYQAFIDDEQAAEEKYIGKVIAIEGSMGYIEEHEGFMIVGFVFQDGLFGSQGIRCIMLENHARQAASLSPGTSVNIKGLCTGFNGYDVIMEHCSFKN
jgi:hypothetical protein